MCVTEIQTEVETAAEAGWSTEKTLCPARPRLGPSPAQRTIVSSAPSTVLMSWFVLPQRVAAAAAAAGAGAAPAAAAGAAGAAAAAAGAGGAVVVKLERPFSTRPEAKATGWCTLQIVLHTSTQNSHMLSSFWPLL